MKNTSRTLFATTILCASLVTVTSANAALQSRLSGQGVYDTDLNITWLTNTNLAATNTFGLATGIDLGQLPYQGASYIYSDGTMNWGGALKWIAAMNTSNYLGYHDWRLPTTLQPDATCGYQSGGVSWGVGCTGSEIGHLAYAELGGAAYQTISTVHNTNYSLFQNLQDYYYWSSTVYTPDPNWAWSLNFGALYQSTHQKGSSTLTYAMAVRGGDSALAAPSSVPVPAAAWLLSSGLLGLVGIARKIQPRNGQRMPGST